MKCEGPCRNGCNVMPSIVINNMILKCPCKLCLVNSMCNRECGNMRMYLHLVGNFIAGAGCEIKTTEEGMVIKYE